MNTLPGLRVEQRMKTCRVRVPWREGLHLRPATHLVRVAKTFRSRIQLRLGDRVADLRSILKVVSLCAIMGSSIEIEAIGDDEDAAIVALEQAFTEGTNDGVLPPPGSVEPDDRTTRRDD